MHKIGIYILILVFIVFGCKNDIDSALYVDNLSLNSDLEQNQIDSIINYVSVFPEGTEISICMIADTDYTFIGFNRSNDSLLIIDNKDKLFEIGSITKIFTTLIFSQLVLCDSLDIDSSIQDYFDFKMNEGQGITLKMLANHTSGLPAIPKDLIKYKYLFPNNEYKNYSKKKLENYIIHKLRLSNKPGDVYQYSNLGISILGYILEKQSGKDFDNLCEDYIYKKYNMTSTLTEYDPTNNLIIQGLNKNGKPIDNPDYNAFKFSGSILSNTIDLSKFMTAYLKNDNEVMRYQTNRTAKINNDLDIALGWVVGCSLTDKRDWIWHNGGCYGYRSCIAADIENNKAVIVLSNVSYNNENAWDIDKLCFRLLETIDNNTIANNVYTK